MIQEGLFPWKRNGLAEAKTGDTVDVDAGFFNSIESTDVKESVSKAEGGFPSSIGHTDLISYDAKVVNDSTRGKVWSRGSDGIVPISEANAFMREVGADNMVDGYWGVDASGKVLSPAGANAEDYDLGATFSCGLASEMLRSNKVILGVKGTRTLKANGRVVRPAVYRRSFFFLGVPPTPAPVFIVEAKSVDFVPSVYTGGFLFVNTFVLLLGSGTTWTPYYVCPSGTSFVQVVATPHYSPGFEYTDKGQRLESTSPVVGYIWFVSDDIDGYSAHLSGSGSGVNRGGYLHLLKVYTSGDVYDDVLSEALIKEAGGAMPSFDGVYTGISSASVVGVRIPDQISVKKDYTLGDEIPQSVVSKMLIPCSESEKRDFAFETMSFNYQDAEQKILGYKPEGAESPIVTVRYDSSTKTDGLTGVSSHPVRTGPVRYTAFFTGLMHIRVNCTWKRGGYGDGKIYVTILCKDWQGDIDVPFWINNPDNSKYADFVVRGYSANAYKELDMSLFGASGSENGLVSFDLYFTPSSIPAKFDIVISKERVSA